MSAAFRNETKITIVAGSACKRAAKLTAEQVGVGSADLDVIVIEIHDAFFHAELQGHEELGLRGDGEGMRMIDECKAEIGGKIPVNTLHGGGLALISHSPRCLRIFLVTSPSSNR